MKPTEVIVVHKTFEKDKDNKRALVLYIADKKGVKRFTKKKALDALAAIKKGATVRFTTVSATDVLLQELHDRGVKINYVNWHATGIEKGLPPEEIAAAFAKVPADVFREFTPNQELTNLRQMVSLRNAHLRSVGDAHRAVQQTARDRGFMKGDDLNDDPLLRDAMQEIEALRTAVTVEGTQLDTHIDKLAKRIPDCVLFAKVAKTKSLGTAAAVMAYSGGFDRFDRVSSVWHYFGQHVRDGAAPKRKKGQPVDWSPKLRTVMYLLGESIIKNRANPWRKVFEKARAKELAAHETKCGCAHPDGHSTARARRKMVKEILKRFFLAVKGQKFIK